MTTLALRAPATFVLAPRVKTVPMQPQASSLAEKTSVIQTRQTMSDEELIAAICLHAEWAIELLYQRYHRFAYSLAYHILRDSTAAEDIVQEVFLSIWQKAASYQRMSLMRILLASFMFTAMPLSSMSATSYPVLVPGPVLP